MARHRVTPVLAALAIISLITPPPASAATVIQHDPVADASAKFDIVRVAYRNDDSGFRYRMKLRDIKANHGILVFPKLLMDKSWDRFFQVTSGARRDGTEFHRLDYYDTESHIRVRCPGMTVGINFRTDLVTATVPQSCLDRVGLANRRYFVVGYAATPGMYDAGDQTSFHWVRYG